MRAVSLLTLTSGVGRGTRAGEPGSAWGRSACTLSLAGSHSDSEVSTLGGRWGMTLSQWVWLQGDPSGSAGCAAVGGRTGGVRRGDPQRWCGQWQWWGGRTWSQEEETWRVR